MKQKCLGVAILLFFVGFAHSQQKTVTILCTDTLPYLQTTKISVSKDSTVLFFDFLRTDCFPWGAAGAGLKTTFEACHGFEPNRHRLFGPQNRCTPTGTSFDEPWGNSYVPRDAKSLHFSYTSTGRVTGVFFRYLAPTIKGTSEKNDPPKFIGVDIYQGNTKIFSDTLSLKIDQWTVDTLPVFFKGTSEIFLRPFGISDTTLPHLIEFDYIGLLGSCTDTCGPISQEKRQISVYNTCGANTIVYKTTNSCYVVYDTVIIIRKDTIRPSLIGINNLLRDTIVPCGGQIPVAPVVTATDNCSSTTIIFRSDTSLIGCNKLIRRIWKAKDICGNVSADSLIQRVTITRGTAKLTIPKDLFLFCTDEIPLSTATFSDGCSKTIQLLPTKQDLVQGCYSTFTNLWEVKDPCTGGVLKGKQKIVIYNPGLPKFVGIPRDTMIMCRWKVPKAPQVTASDRCDTLPVTYKQYTKYLDCYGWEMDIIRIWTTRTHCGFFSSLEVRDTQLIMVRCGGKDVTSSSPLEARSSVESSPTDLTIFPNPFNDQITVRSSEKKEIKIFSLSGRLVGTYPTNQKLFLSHLPSGVYLIDGKKVIKQ